MDLDLTLTGKSQVIRKREAIRLNRNIWVWGAEETTCYPNTQHELLNYLFSGSDLNLDLDIKNEPSSSQDQIKTDSGIGSTSTITTPQPTGNDYWKPPKIKLKATYLVPGIKRSRWTKAKLVKINEEYIELIDMRSCKPIKTEFKFLAHPEPVCPKLLAVGSRVIVMVSEIGDTGEVTRGCRIHKLGVVGEYPTEKNKSRYLVICDDGTWCYVEPKYVRPLYYYPKMIWKVVPWSIRKTVEDLLNGFYKSEFDFKQGDIISIKKRQMVEHCNVLKVDCSLLLVWYATQGKSEWIHCNSPFINMI